ncbi:MAG: efflux RND transporter periplasmic adaptor subunit [Novosphingobium sp.]
MFVPLRLLPTPSRTGSSRTGSALLLALVAALGACGPSSDKSGDKQGRDKGPPEVGFRVMHPVTVTQEVDLPGRITAAQTAEVRPQVSGIIQQRLFTEGSLVRAGQPLYRIDQSLYRASQAQAQANLASSLANAQAAQEKANRYRPLAEQGAIARQDYTDAAAAARQAQASVAQSRAALSTTQINLRFTTVPAPISGRIGRSLFTVGALVTNGQADPLAQISQLDPVYVDLKQSAADLLRLRRQMAGEGSAPVAATATLVLDDGSAYPQPGRVAFSEVTADPATGTVTLRAQFPNPQGLLMPGMFVHAKLAQASQAGVFLVPQVAVTRDPAGQAQVYVVSQDGKAQARTITAPRTQGDAWVVTEGLSNGDRVITQGLGKLKAGPSKAGQPVKPVPETAPQQPRPAKRG